MTYSCVKRIMVAFKYAITTIDFQFIPFQSDIQRREANHQEMYFKMYMKGQNAAQFERQDEVNFLSSFQGQLLCQKQRNRKE